MSNNRKNKRFIVQFFMLLGLIALFMTACQDSGGGCGQSDDAIKPLPDPASIHDDVTTPDSTDSGPPEDVVYTDENLLNGIPIIGVRKVVDGMYQSYLTGEWKDVDIAKRRALAVIISNNRPALPQYGLSKANIIFEAAVEGRTSRLVAYFEDYDDIERIGPVRSARDYFVYDSNGKDTIFCHWGLAVPYTADLINSDRVDNISQAVGGVAVSSSEAYTRVNRPGYSYEYTGYLVPSGYTKAVERLGYREVYRDDFVPQFTFAAEDTRVEYEDYPDVSVIRPGGTGTSLGGYGNTNPYFEYNEEDGLYYRFQSGSKQVDEMNNEQLTFSNVVFQVAHGEVRDANDYLAFRVHGEGEGAIVFTNGKMIEGNWHRENDRVPAKFYDTDGNEIIFNQGNTWICLIWDQYADAMVLE